MGSAIGSVKINIRGFYLVVVFVFGLKVAYDYGDEGRRTQSRLWNVV